MTLDDQITTAQQEAGLAAYRAQMEIDGEENMIPFWTWYMYWQFENNLYCDISWANVPEEDEEYEEWEPDEEEYSDYDEE